MVSVVFVVPSDIFFIVLDISVLVEVVVVDGVVVAAVSVTFIVNAAFFVVERVIVFSVVSASVVDVN